MGGPTSLLLVASNEGRKEGQWGIQITTIHHKVSLINTFHLRITNISTNRAKQVLLFFFPLLILKEVHTYQEQTFKILTITCWKM